MPNQSLQISALPEDLKGQYSNVVMVSSQEREVVLDFLAVTGTGEAQHRQLQSRIFLNHFTARELVQAIQTNLANWEKMRYEVPKK